MERQDHADFLTVISTILGFILFMLGTDKEAFWFPLAAGTIGGLIMSILGIFFYLPIFTLKKKNGIKQEYVSLTDKSLIKFIKLMRHT